MKLKIATVAVAAAFATVLLQLHWLREDNRQLRKDIELIVLVEVSRMQANVDHVLYAIEDRNRKGK